MEETGPNKSLPITAGMFRKRAAAGPFEVFTDYPSRLKHYERIAWFVGIIGLLNLAIGIWI
jgi:hypothetical protein